MSSKSKERLKKNTVNASPPLFMRDKFSKIESYGRRYIKDFVLEDKNELLRDPHKALLFFYHRVFNRGRRDEVSTLFRERTVQVLETVRPLQKGTVNLRDLGDRLLKNGVNNHKDREMVVDSIKFISALSSKNVVKYAVSLVKENKIGLLFRQMDGIKHIGSKLASLFLRDLVFLYQLEECVSCADEAYCQPIDTWVRQVAVKLGVVSAEERDTGTIQARIIEEAKRQGVSSWLFNAGAWYVGARSFDLLLETL